MYHLSEPIFNSKDVIKTFGRWKVNNIERYRLVGTIRNW